MGYLKQVQINKYFQAKTKMKLKLSIDNNKQTNFLYLIYFGNI